MTKNKAILVVSFGTSLKETREKTIGAIEQDIAKAFPEYEVRRAFTSSMILKILKNRDGLHIHNVEEALLCLAEDGFQQVIVQPTHVINGEEYEKMMAQIEAHRTRFQQLAVGKPLLSSSEDFQQAVEAIMEHTPQLQENQALVLMGHGTEHHTDAVYAALDYRFKEMGFEHVYVGTVEGYPGLDQIKKQLKKQNLSKALLMPFMVVAGDHAVNDMCGDDEDSWKSQLQKEGLEVQWRLQGIGEFQGIRNMYMDHLKTAMTQL